MNWSGFATTNKWPNQHIRMISEGSCDMKTGETAAENSALSSQEEITFEKIYKRKSKLQ